MPSREMRDWLGVRDSRSWDDAVRGVCSPKCMQYLVDTVLCVCCTRVYDVLGVNY